MSQRITLVQPVWSSHDPQVPSRAQHKKSSMQSALVPSDTADASATSGTTAFALTQNCIPQNVPPVALFAETVKDDNSLLDFPNMPGLRVHHPSTDSNSEDSKSTFCFLTCVSPSALQSFAPLLQWCTFEHITAHTGPLWCGHKKCLRSAFNLKELWSTGSFTWEPLDAFFQDAPEDVVINCA